MAGRQHPWVRTVVPWSEDEEYTRGRTSADEILLSWGIAPRDKLATRRQLRAMGLRPGGHPPVALLYFYCRHACKKTYANLYLISNAVPVRPMTDAKRAAVATALTARRTCKQCGEDAGVELPKAKRVCEPCLVRLGLEPDSYLHDYLTGTPIDPEHDGHPATEPAPVVPLRATQEQDRDAWEVAA